MSRALRVCRYSTPAVIPDHQFHNNFKPEAATATNTNGDGQCENEYKALIACARANFNLQNCYPELKDLFFCVRDADESPPL